MSEYDKRISDVITELAKMETADQVADFLRRKGITGFPTWPDQCPVANLFHAALQDVDFERRTPPIAGVGELIWHDFADMVSPRCSVRLPSAVVAFVREFDQGKYPDLIEGA